MLSGERLDKFDLAAEVLSGGNPRAERVFKRVAQSARKCKGLQGLTEEELEKRYSRLCHQLAGFKPRGDLKIFWEGGEGGVGLTVMERKLERRRS